RIRSAVGVPPGSFVTSTLGMRSASLRSCVVFPEPSIPSSVMNTETVFQPAKIMLAHQFLEHVVARQKSKPFAKPRSTPQARELPLVREAAGLELVDAEEVAELGVFAVEDRSRFADCVLAPGE